KDRGTARECFGRGQRGSRGSQGLPRDDITCGPGVRPRPRATSDNRYYVNSLGGLRFLTARPAPLPLAWDVGFFRELGPFRLPRGEREAELVAELPDLVGERLPDLVVVAELEPVPPVELVLRRPRAPEDVQRPDVPLVEGRLRLGVGRRVW